jgi:hypothetical protein
LLQELSDPDDSHRKFLQKPIFIGYVTMGALYTVVEISSYVILFHFIHNHNKQNVLGLLDQSAIQKRTRENAISLTGLFAGWLMEVWYIGLVGFFAIISDGNLPREVATVFKYFEFYLIPLVEIQTSPAIRRFMTTMRERNFKND